MMTEENKSEEDDERDKSKDSYTLYYNRCELCRCDYQNKPITL